MTVKDLRKWLAFGTGVGIEIGAKDLRVAVTRVRPTGTHVLGAALIEQFGERPAAEWGTDYLHFLRQLGGSHLAATVLLPRRDLIVRVLQMPGVEDKDLASAVGYQIDSLHPYPEEEVVYSCSRVGTGGGVLVAITRRAVVDRYSSLFEQAGIKISSFTCSAAALYSAVRLLAPPPADGFVTLFQDGDAQEVYGEGPAQPVFSALFEQAEERALALSAAQLRLAPEAEPVDIGGLLPVPRSMPVEYDLKSQMLPYATALAGACAHLSLDINLLPVEQRSASSRMIYVPTAVLGTAALVLAVMLVGQSAMEDRRYLAVVERELARLEPQANQTVRFDRATNQARARTVLLDQFRRRTKADLDVLTELTRLLQPPSWLAVLDMNREQVTTTGEIDQAAGLLKTLDGSKLFRNSQFTSPLGRAGTNDVFRIRSDRQGGLP
jgi:hypothetical protein